MTKTNCVGADSKWGPLFLGEPLVPLFIPEDPLNPQKQRWLAINGQEIILAVGEPLVVPQSVATLWQQSNRADQAAQALLRQVVELNG